MSGVFCSVTVNVLYNTTKTLERPMNFFSDPRTVYFTSPAIQTENGGHRSVTYLMPKSLCDEVGNPRCGNMSCRSHDVSQVYDTASNIMSIECRACGCKEQWYNDYYFGWVHVCPKCNSANAKRVYNEYRGILVCACLDCDGLIGHMYFEDEGWLGCGVHASARNWTAHSR